MTPDQDRLVADTLDLTDRVAARFARGLPASVDREAVRGAARLGLVQAASRYDPGRQRWHGFCLLRVYGAMLDELKQQDPAGNRHGVKPLAATTVSLDDATLERLAGRGAFVDRLCSRLDLLEALGHLTGRQLGVVLGVVVRDRRGVDVAAELGVHESRVSNIKREALDRLRVSLAAGDA